jgi:hypothetical protein
MVLGNTARIAPYGLRGPGNDNIDASIRRTFDLWKSENVKFIFEASVFNVVNHVWLGSASSTADGSIGTSFTPNTAASNFGVVACRAKQPAAKAARRSYQHLSSCNVVFMEMP